MELRYAVESKMKKKVEKENARIKAEVEELKKTIKDMKVLEEKRCVHLATAPHAHTHTRTHAHDTHDTHAHDTHDTHDTHGAHGAHGAHDTLT
jgi:hypothetical protein